MSRYLSDSRKVYLVTVCHGILGYYHLLVFPGIVIWLTGLISCFFTIQERFTCIRSDESTADLICHFFDSGVAAGCCIDRACAVLTHRSLTDMNSGRCQHVLPAARGAQCSGRRKLGEYLKYGGAGRQRHRHRMASR